MKPSTRPDALLDDVLADAAPPDFRAALLEATLRTARSRRRRRRLSQVLVLIVVTAALIVLVRPRPLGTPEVARDAGLPPPACAVIRSQPLPPSMVVRSGSGGVRLIESSRDGLVVVETAPGPGLVREVSDQELLTLLAGRPAAILRPRAQPAQLLFVNPVDREGFPVH